MAYVLMTINTPYPAEHIERDVCMYTDVSFPDTAVGDLNRGTGYGSGKTDGHL